jgi:hypothetical protein
MALKEHRTSWKTAMQKPGLKGQQSRGYIGSVNWGIGLEDTFLFKLISRDRNNLRNFTWPWSGMFKNLILRLRLLSVFKFWLPSVTRLTVYSTRPQLSGL